MKEETPFAMKVAIRLFLGSIIILIFAVVVRLNGYKDIVPTEPDYADSTQWYISRGSIGADVFYILPTCVFNVLDPEAKTVCRYMDTYNPDQRKAVAYSQQVAAEMFGDCDLYIPYYRQITMECFGENEQDKYFPLALEDLKRAFDYWQENYNGGRPFILAGFSQGGWGVVELTKLLSPQQRSRLIASYVIGYKVTARDLENENIVPAKDSIDLGVTICYNSASTPDAAWPSLTKGNRLCINPVNWTTAPVPARLPGGVTVVADTLNKILLVSGYEGNQIKIPALDKIIPPGNYHLSEPALYKDHIRHNVQVRCARY